MDKKKIKHIIKHILIFIVLIGILLFLLFKNGGLISRNKGLDAQGKLDEAMQKYSNGEFTNFFEAINNIDGYKGINEIQNGFYMVNIDGTHVMVSHEENVGGNTNE